MGWLTVFFWPAPIFVVLFLARAALDNASAEILVVVFVFLSAVGMSTHGVYLLGKWLTRRAEGLYECPVCGHDIMNTPHRCPNCGTRLIWGYLPGPRDRTYPQADSEHCPLTGV
jgi:predicted RNA-binding Zn-ribbon protein involved in translation (DUF1610 family)